MADIEEEFKKITEQLGDMGNPAVALALSDISQALEALNEAGYHLGAYLTKLLSTPSGSEVEVPYDLVNILPDLADTSQAISDILHLEICEACAEEALYSEDEDD